MYTSVDGSFKEIKGILKVDDNITDNAFCFETLR